MCHVKMPLHSSDEEFEESDEKSHRQENKKIIRVEEREPSEPVPSLCLFKHSRYRKLKPATKYFLYMMWKTSFVEPLCDLNFTEDQLNESLKDFDFLTFPWHKIPRIVFQEVFDNMTMERLGFFCGYFSTFFDHLDSSHKQLVINSLWNHFVKVSKQAQTV